MKRQRTNNGYNVMRTYGNTIPIPRNNAMRTYRNATPIPRNNTTTNIHAELTGPQKTLAAAIIRGDLEAVRGLNIFSGYYDTPFDTKNHKLVAFAMYHALRNPTDSDRVLIVHYLLNHEKMPIKGHGLSTAIKGTKKRRMNGHSVAHVAGRHAITTNSFNRMRHRNAANPSQGLLVPNFNKYAKKKNVHGLNASQYSKSEAVRKHIEGVIGKRVKPPTNRMNINNLVSGFQRI
jgi:hypothetical protein